MKNKFFISFKLIFLFLLTGGSLFAQFNFKIEGVVKENGKGVGGAVVSLTTDETGVKKETTTGSGGGFSFSLKQNEEYTIYVSKTGYIKPKIMYSTMGFSEEDAKKFKGVSNPEIEIFKLPEDEKLSEKINEAFEKPLMSYLYSSEKSGVTLDEDGYGDMQQEFAKMQKLTDDFKNNSIPIETKYNTAITKADKAFALKDYELAKTSYNDALGFKPKEQYPKTQIAEADRLIAIATDAARLAKDKAAADAADKERLAKAKADADAAEKERIAKDKAAADAAEKEKLAKQKEAADAATAEKDRLAKEKAAADEKARLAKEAEQADAAEKARLEKEKTDAAFAEKQRKAKEEADAAADRARLEKEKIQADIAEKERKAKEAADAATAAREKEAKDKADAAEKVRLAKEAEQAEAAEKARLEKEKADAALAEKQRKEKEAADAVAAEKERIAKEKAAADAAEIERLAKQKEMEDAAEKERLAKEAAIKAVTDRYMVYINRGDSAISEQNYPLAKLAFNEAQKVKPEETTPKTRLADIETLILNNEQYKNELAKKYPVGLTEEKTKEKNMDVTRRIVVIGNKGVLYEKKETTFGAVYYFKDGTPITDKEYNKETNIK